MPVILLSLCCFISVKQGGHNDLKAEHLNRGSTEGLLKSMESKIPLSNLKSWLIQLIAIWPQASQLQIAARGEDAEEKSGATMTGPWRVCMGCPEPGPVSDIHQSSVGIWWKNKKAQEEVEERQTMRVQNKSVRFSILWFLVLFDSKIQSHPWDLSFL